MIAPPTPAEPLRPAPPSPAPRRLAPLLLATLHLSPLLLACQGAPAGPAAIEEGYADGRQAGYRAGHARGLERGYQDGLAVGRTEALGRFGPVGTLIGGALGLGLVLFLRREDLRAALATRRRRRRLARYRAPHAHLPPAAAAQLDALLGQLASLEPALGQAALAPLARAAADLIQLQTRLTAALAAAPPPDPARLTALRAKAADPTAQQTLTTLEHAAHAHTRATAHATAVALQLEALAAQLGHLQLSLVNLDAAETTALTPPARLTATLDAAEAALTAARRELADL